MSIALELYDATGARVPEPYIFVDELNASHFETPESRLVLIRGHASVIFEVVCNVQLEERDNPVDVLKIRPKSN